MRVLLTGANGHLGDLTLRELTRQGHSRALLYPQEGGREAVAAYRQEGAGGDRPG